MEVDMVMVMVTVTVTDTDMDMDMDTVMDTVTDMDMDMAELTTKHKYNNPLKIFLIIIQGRRFGIRQNWRK